MKKSERLLTISETNLDFVKRNLVKQKDACNLGHHLLVIGKVKKKVEPTPISRSAQIFPP